MIWWLRHPIEAWRYWWYDYGGPNWRTDILRPFLRKAGEHEHSDRPHQD